MSNDVKAAWIAGILGIIGSIIGISQCNPPICKDCPPPQPPICKDCPPPKPPKPDSLSHNKDWEWEDLEGKKGKDTLRVRLVYKILADEFRWKFGSHEYLDNGEKLKETLPKYLYSLPDFKQSLGIISVGMCSEEGNKVAEIDRGIRRADNIMLAVRPHEVALNKATYKLNLGQHRRTDGKTSDETSYQRKVIVIGIMKWTGDLTSTEDLRECLKDALSKSIGLSFQTNSYSNFDLVINKIDYKREEVRN